MNESKELLEISKSLASILDAYEGKSALISNQGQALDGFSALANFVSVAEKARRFIKANSDEQAMHTDAKVTVEYSSEYMALVFNYKRRGFDYVRLIDSDDIQLAIKCAEEAYEKYLKKTSNP